MARSHGRLTAMLAAGALTAFPVLGASAGPRATALADMFAQPVGPVVLSVTSVTPSYATPRHTVTVTGTVRNLTGQTLSGLTIRLLSSRSAFASMGELQQYVMSEFWPLVSPLAVPLRQVPALAAHGTAHWQLTFPAKALGVCAFGVYPVTIQASDPAGDFARTPVPLPYWPAKARSCPGRTPPAPDPISWIWPMIDNPHQGACPDGLVDNSLAASIAAGGRLYGLLGVGRRYAAAAHLTWAIDPALLGNLHTMTVPYLITGAAGCGGTQHPADAGAGAWLSDLVRATKGQAVFVTPYADVDMAALASGAGNDLKYAYLAGDHVARQVLGRSPVPAAVPARSDRLSAVAWPTGGRANQALLEVLGVQPFNVNTVILSTPPSASYLPGGVASLTTGSGNRLHVLLPDSAIGQLLGSAHAHSRDQGTIFQVSQAFLAETAMIIAGSPRQQHPIIVAPPRRWNPAEVLADKLLAGTAGAPWLIPMNIGHLVALPARHAGSVEISARGSLSHHLLRQIARLDGNVQLLDQIFDPAGPGGQPQPPLNLAVFGIESSAWQGQGARHAEAMLARTATFVDSQFADLQIEANKKVLLGGSGGTLPISIRNGLSYSVHVRVKWSVSNTTVRVTDGPIIVTIPPHKIQSFRLHVQATQTGSAWVKLILTTPGGKVGTPLPHIWAVMHVEVTRFGTIALLICAAGLALFVLGSAVRAIRHGPSRAVPAVSPVPLNQPAQPDNVSDPGPAPSLPEASTVGPSSAQEER